MDNPQIADKFLNENFFQNDKLLKEYFNTKKYDKFRTRVKYFKDYSKKLELTLYAMITHSIQDILYKEAASMGKTLSPAGFLVLSGGAAINQYLPDDMRTVTTDIDFKFVPAFLNVPVTSEKYFGYLQYAKLFMWDEIGKLAKKMSDNALVKKRLKVLQDSAIGKCLKVNFDKMLFTRRYIIIHKKKQSQNNKVTMGNVLVDVELFAMDLRGIKFFPSKYDSLSGILDFPIMKRGELGGQVMRGVKRGIVYKTVTGRKVFNPSILVANKTFLIEDIYLMKSLGLRPEKKAKDKERLIKLAKYAFKININKSASNLNIMTKTGAVRKRRLAPLKQKEKLPIDKIAKINPFNYEKYTTKLTRRQIGRIAFPTFGPAGLNIKNYTPVNNTRFTFDTKTHKWVRASHRAYVRNTANYRVNHAKSSNWQKAAKLKGVNLTAKPSVYGYSITRNKWIPSDVLSKVAKMPLVGHKGLSKK